MNLIINHILCFVILYLFLLSFINLQKEQNPLKYKLFIFSIIFIIQLCIILTENINNNCNYYFNDLIKKAILYGLFFIIGYSIYIDLNLFLLKDYFIYYNDNIYIKYLLMTFIITIISFIFASLDVIITNNIYNECNNQNNKNN
jgi:hypothetical protein